MEYIFKTDVPSQEFNTFIGNRSFAPVFQTESWGMLKSDWRKYFCGIYKDGNICGAALILVRKLAPTFKLAYCPRGPVLDFEDEEVFNTFISGIKAFAKKEGIYSVKIDPMIPLNITPPKLDPSEFDFPFENVYSDCIDKLFSSEFSYKKLSLSLSDYIQPRFNMIVPLAKKNGEMLSYSELKKHFKQSERKYLGTFVSNRGLFFETLEINDDNIEMFSQIMNSTGARKNLYLRNADYFKRLLISFGSNARLFCVKTDINVYVKYLENGILKGSEEDEKKNRELIAKANIIKDKCGNIVPLSAAIVIMPPNVNGVRMAEYLYAGSDLGFFPQFCAADVMLYEIMKYCIDEKCQFLNLGGVEGTFDDGLYAFKSKFNPIIVEYIGEFDIVLNHFKYRIVENHMPTLSRIYRRIVSLGKRRG